MARKPTQRRVSRGVRAAMREIDEELERVNRGLSGYDALVRERQRLLAARAALSGERPSGARGRTTQDEVAAYLIANPGSWPAQIAAALNVPVTNVSAHLYRAKASRFERRNDGWHVRSGGGEQAR